ncbi:MAG: FixH family protein [Devosiaceae bacterium]|nr:FixH family protein [Devosiaceae bacterium]
MQANSENTKPQKQFTGKHMLIIMLCFFGIIFSMNLLMSMQALNAWTGLVVKNTYVASQEYNDKLEANRAQHALGWTSNIEVKDQVLLFSLLDGESLPIKAEQVEVQVNRPVGTKEDLQLILEMQENGIYSANAKLASGTWRIYVVASFADQPDFEHFYKINIEE